MRAAKALLVMIVFLAGDINRPAALPRKRQGSGEMDG
jgi:hypothetical protein